MISDKELRNIIEKVVKETMSASNPVASSSGSGLATSDLGLVNLREQILVDNPLHLEELKRLRRHTPARIAIGRAGTRYKTETVLRFRADHAVAQDAVFTDVADEFLGKHNLKAFKTKCNERNEFITRPDLGRAFERDQLDQISRLVEKDAQVLIYVADGLSSTAVESNAGDVLRILTDGLRSKGIKVATPFFVKYGRVGAMEAIGEATGVDVICVLIGERPGLVTAESMSAYFAYKPTIGMSEARRTVISNIHKGGTPAVEAGSHLVDILKKALDNKASGLDLKI